jgi:hypothetical protein
MTQGKHRDSSGSERRESDERRVEKRREHERFVPSDAARSDRRQAERRREHE